MNLNTEAKEAKSGPGLVNSLLTLQNLQYKLPPSATVVVEKSSKTYFADKTEYSDTDDRIVFVLNSGSDFINAANSFLRFNLKTAGNSTGADDANAVTFGSGSAANIFSEIIIRSRDSVEVERIRNLNSLIATQLKWMYSQDYNDKSATMAGVGGRTEIQAVDLSSAAGADKGASYCIPMKWLCGLFNVDSLLPSFLMSGLRIELVLADYRTALVDGSAVTSTGYKVSNPTIRLETCKLSDSIMNALTERAANEGLKVTMSTWDLTQSTSAASQVNIEVRRNISQCFGAVVKNRITTQITNHRGDSMASEATHNVTSYRFRLGSQFIPSSAVDDKTEHFALAQIAFDKFKQSNAENAVSYNNYVTGGYSVIATDLERSALEMSGQAISNSRLLAYEANMTNVNAGRTIDVFVNFVRVVTCYLSNTLVEE